ncbi:MAG TPA: hypothetical protein PK228_09690, partial [Saprospiraceae bacterium]|nr:hypothetical protein [Saprospiraceae bacterium]
TSEWAGSICQLDFAMMICIFLKVKMGTKQDDFDLVVETLKILTTKLKILSPNLKVNLST